ncbi:hypothetical protein K443DRAFT_684619 [Laccaria amethystina LaAM-08-1]|uniref:Uncharacterized protein n=1 Tax=Laccaria amethystina LaAM-08-1 TaxID=1095629 RepID=A0A0C9X6R5_9AGAR|nr:hypothetical protein K443DRAFT_684619 [Laccaria amethystina LaAM-08-1]
MTLQVLDTDIGYTNPKASTCSRCRQTNAWASRQSIAFPSCPHLPLSQSGISA